jgi:hypothetical protein
VLYTKGVICIRLKSFFIDFYSSIFPPALLVPHQLTDFADHGRSLVGVLLAKRIVLAGNSPAFEFPRSDRNMNAQSMHPQLVRAGLKEGIHGEMQMRTLGQTAVIASAIPRTIVVALCLLQAACVFPKKLAPREATSNALEQADPPRENERLVVVPDGGDDDRFDAVCARKAVADRALLSSAEFRQVPWPTFDSGNAATSERAFADMLEKTSLREKAAALGVRYVVIVHGETSTSANDYPKDSGLVVNTRSTSASFQAWDLARAKLLGNGTYNVSGEQSWGAFVGLFPVAIWAPTESAVCKKAAQRLREIFAPA